jgi:hypothetical protein
MYNFFIMKPTEKQIEEIADSLDFGMRCFFNVRSGEIKELPDLNSWLGADMQPWEEDSEEIDANWDDYFEFDGFESRDSFRMMADFAESVDDTGLQDRLIHALNRSKPFHNFKWQIDNSGKYRQRWFDFKKMRYIQWVKEQIDLNSEAFTI